MIILPYHSARPVDPRQRASAFMIAWACLHLAAAAAITFSIAILLLYIRTIEFVPLFFLLLPAFPFFLLSFSLAELGRSIVKDAVRLRRTQPVELFRYIDLARFQQVVAILFCVLLPLFCFGFGVYFEKIFLFGAPPIVMAAVLVFLTAARSSLVSAEKQTKEHSPENAP